MRSFILIALLAGCGGKAKPAQDQASPQLQLPEFEGKGKAPFALTDEQSDLTYKGNLLFWQDDVTPEKIKRVSEASINGRLVRAKYLKFFRDEHAPAQRELNEKKAEAVELDTRVIQSRKDNFGDIVELQKPLLVSWVPTRLEQLRAAGKVSSDDVAAANAQLGVYCQAKLWETAVDPLLVRSYASRPTPLVMCEAYYAEAKLLDKTTDACKDAPAGQTKNYVDCFWKEGVVKTEMMASRTTKCKASDPTSPTRFEAVQAWVADGSLQAALKMELANANFSARGNLGAAVVGSGSLPETLLTPACKPAFQGKAGLAPGVQTLIKPLQQLLNIVEASAATLGASATTYELLIPSTDGSSEDIVARYEMLGEDLRKFAVRYGGPSVNDRIFNNDAQKSVRESEEIRAQYDAAPGFAAVRKVEADYVPVALKESKAANLARTVELEKILKDQQDTEFDLNTEVADVLREGALASMDDGVSQTLVGFSLRLTKIEDRIEVRVQFGSGRGAVGCTTLAGSACSVERTEKEAAWTDLGKVTFNADHNELAVDVLLDDPAAQGLIFEALETKHNLLPEDEWKGRTLRLTAYSNQLEGVLDFFTGKAELFNGSEVVREGSISGDAYDANAAVWK